MKKLLLTAFIAFTSIPTIASELFVGGQLARTAGEYTGSLAGYPVSFEDDSILTQLRLGRYLTPQHRIMATMEWNGDESEEFGLLGHYDYMIPLSTEWTANIGGHFGTRFIDWEPDDFSTLQYGVQFGATYHIAPQLDFGVNMRVSAYNGKNTIGPWQFEKNHDATFGFSIDYRL
ncbi:hypothetical protein [Thaumasiovibrio sp. DFM-14]|uniref:hypothetical protein n=1 Tax=Thaumasiovibrio sp. DFM-14 TaxID=3384792 RepID=UPI0039A32AE2